jgi:hypothetical protein
MSAPRLHNFLKIQATGETFMAGDFPVTVIESSGSGSYSGTGFVEVPYLGDTKLKVVFKNIKHSFNLNAVHVYNQTKQATENKSINELTATFGYNYSF